MQLKLRNTLARTTTSWNLGLCSFLVPSKEFSKRIKRTAVSRINTSQLAPSARSVPQLKPKVQQQEQKLPQQKILHNPKQGFKRAPVSPETLTQFHKSGPSPHFSLGEAMNTSRFPKPMLTMTPEVPEITEVDLVEKLPNNANAKLVAKQLQLSLMEVLEVAENLESSSIDQFSPLNVSTLEQICTLFDKEVELIEPARPVTIERPPVITIMGHVDHGKTTLLDALRHSNIVDTEYGQITQSIGAFTVNTQNNEQITFIDTPGHAAFTNMRVRGAKTTDMVIMVVSAIQGIQQQTYEVMEIIRKHNLPTVIAINKCDSTKADPEAVELALAQKGMVSSNLGGPYTTVYISAKEKQGLDELENALVKEAESIDLKANCNGQTECYVIESDIKDGQVTASVIVKSGTLKVEDYFICGQSEGRVKNLRNDKGQIVKQALPGESVFVCGFRSEVDIGSALYTLKDQNEAKHIVRSRMQREQQLAASKKNNFVSKKVGRFTRRQKKALYAGDTSILVALLEGDRSFFQRDAQKLKDKFGKRFKQKLYWERVDKKFEVARQRNIKEKEQMKHMFEGETMDEKLEINQENLNSLFKNEEKQFTGLYLKAKTAGALEALLKNVNKVIAANNHCITIMGTEVCNTISQKDLYEAGQSNSVIMGFDVECIEATNKENSPCVRIFKLLHNIIENVEDLCNDAQLDLGECVGHKVLSTATIKKVFSVNQRKGLKVQDGTLNKHALFRVLRDGEVIAEGLKAKTLRIVDKPATIVEAKKECGLELEDYSDIMELDVIQTYEEEERERKFDRAPGVKYCD